MTARIAKPVVVIIVAAVLVIAALYVDYLRTAKVDSMITTAVKLKADERDAYWIGKIEKANAEINKKAADQATTVLKIQADVAEKNFADQQTLADLKVKNAHLANADSCGLSGDRVGLLPH